MLQSNLFTAGVEVAGVEVDEFILRSIGQCKGKLLISEEGPVIFEYVDFHWFIRNPEQIQCLHLIYFKLYI